MALTVELKPGERMLIGDCVVTNGDQRTRLKLEGAAPILREKDVMVADGADTPAKRVYLVVQLMYTTGEPANHHDAYFRLIRDIAGAAPSMWPRIQAINNHLLTGDLYKALKEAGRLIAYEEELIRDAQRGAELR
jgi:flagellar protein FlbT